MTELLKFWTPDGFEASSFRNGISERYNKSYFTSGSDNSKKCLYTYNELGFRGDSIYKKGFKIMSLGCSNTEGVGLNYDETWPKIFSDLIPDGVNMNFGMGGRSNDFIFRCLHTFFDVIKPDLVLIMYTFPQRRDFYPNSKTIEPYMAANNWGFMKDTKEGVEIQNLLDQLQCESENFINWYKNHLLIKYFLETKKCNWVWNGSFINNNFAEPNRFDGEYRKFIDYGVDGVHPGFKHNYRYIGKLYTFLIENFPDYIPYENHVVQFVERHMIKKSFL